MPSKSFDVLAGLLAHVDQLEDAHGNLQAGRGRRHHQDAIHRAGIVMSVAAWESYVEHVLVEAIESICPPAGSPLSSMLVYRVMQNNAKTAVSKFNTPNWQQVQGLFQTHLGFDPTASWTWVSPKRQWGSKEMRDHLDEWLLVRHSVAHGGQLSARVTLLKNRAGNDTFRLEHLQKCREFVKRIASQTDAAVPTFLVATFGVNAPW